MNKHDIDKISLEQALIDVEIANKRVLDLTARLTELSRELLEARARLNGGAVQAIDYGRTGADEKLRQIAASRVYRLARLISPKLRGLL